MTLSQAISCDDEGFLSFLQHLLQVHPVNRPYAEEALQHPWLKVDYDEGIGSAGGSQTSRPTRLELAMQQRQAVEQADQTDQAEAMPARGVGTGVGLELVSELRAEFAAAYNEGDMARAAMCCYAADCSVTVNGGQEQLNSYGPFKTPAEVAGFLAALQEELGGTNMSLQVVGVHGNMHEDEWSVDSGGAVGKALWALQADGVSWRIVDEEITFTTNASGRTNTSSEGDAIKTGGHDGVASAEDAEPELAPEPSVQDEGTTQLNDDGDSEAQRSNSHPIEAWLAGSTSQAK
eukprot:SAG31_NODE_769_length_12212_cov_5.357508_4_plen_291_part_00